MTPMDVALENATGTEEQDSKTSHFSAGSDPVRRIVWFLACSCSLMADGI
jgi:hypothetical protein